MDSPDKAPDAADSAVDITSTPSPSLESSLLSGLHVPTAGALPAPPAGTLAPLLAHYADRAEDARDALLEQPAIARAADAAGTGLAAGAALVAFAKRAAWVVGTSALLLVVPLLYELDKEMNGAEAAAAAPAEGATSGAAGVGA